MPSKGLRIVDVSLEQLGQLPCCGIMNTAHEGHRCKTAWLREQLPLGLRAKLLMTEDDHQVGYIEYTPGEEAWRGVEATGYMFIHCIWTYYRRYQHQGNATGLVRACVRDARTRGMRGVAVLARQKSWLASSDLFVKCGFEVVGTAPPDYTLLARKFRKGDANPAFRPGGEDRLRRYRKGLTIIYARQCPHAIKFARDIGESAERDFGLKPRRVLLRTSREARDAPTPSAVFSIILDGRVLVDHQISRTRFRNIMKQQLGG